MDLCEDSPITQRSASTKFDLPQPFGPTTPVKSGFDQEIGRFDERLEAEQAQSCEFHSLRPHAFFLLAHDLFRKIEFTIFRIMRNSGMRTRHSIRLCIEQFSKPFRGLAPIQEARLPHRSGE